MEASLLMSAAFHMASLMLGARLSGVSAPDKLRAAIAALGSALIALCLIACGVSWAALCTLPLAALLCFFPQGRACVCRAAVMTLLCSFLMGGCGVFLERTTGSKALAALLAAATGMAMLPLIKLLPSALLRPQHIELSVGGRQVLLPAMTDTGNLLRDPVTGDPVVVVGARAVKPLFPDLISPCDGANLPEGFRLLRVQTAAGSAMMPLFRPGLMTLYQGDKRFTARALVAVAPSDYRGVQALVPADLPVR